MAEVRLRKSGKIGLVKIYLLNIVQGLIFFAAAGRLNIPRGWLCFGLTALCMTAIIIALLIYNPELINQRSERMTITRWWDRIFFIIYVPMLFIIPAIIGLDVGRFRWTYLSGYFCILGVVCYIFFLVLAGWAMVVNPHFEPTVRIQKDRDHRVIASGPYRLVRHPGYLAGIVGGLAPSLIIGSTVAFIPIGISMIVLIVRTALEDKTLHSELNGYSEYAKKVEYRLLPGIW